MDIVPALVTRDINFTAMIRDDKKVLLLQKQQPIKPTVYMYTSAGKLIEQIQVCSNAIISAAI